MYTNIGLQVCCDKKFIMEGFTMGGELAVGTIVNQENLAKAKMICSGFKALIINYKNKSLVYKVQIEKIKIDLKKSLAEKRMADSTELYITSMQMIQKFMKRFDVERMTQQEEKIFYDKLEKLNDELDVILEEFSKRGI